MITVSSQPVTSSLQAAYLSVPYTVRQSGVSSELPPALEIVPINRGNELTAYPIGVTKRTGVSYVYELDLSGVAGSLINKISGLPSQAITPFRTLPDSVIALSVRFIEFATNTEGLLSETGEEKTTNSCFVIDAYRRADDANATISDYGNYSRPLFLSRRSRSLSLPITVRDTLTVFNAGATGNAAPTTSASLTAVFKFYDDGSELLATTSVVLPGATGELSQFGFGPADIALLPMSGAPDISTVNYYSVRVGRTGTGLGGGIGGEDPEPSDLDASGDVVEVYVEKGPCNDTVVYFYNSFGAWDMALFRENTIQQYTLGGSNYTRLGRTITEERRSRWSMTVTSSTDTSEEADALLDLANSSLIYVSRAGRLIPVTLNASALPVAYGAGSNGKQPFQFTLRAATETASQRTY